MNAVKNVSFDVRAGEIVCIAGIDGNGQTELIYGLTGLEKATAGKITLLGKDISNASIRTWGRIPSTPSFPSLEVSLFLRSFPYTSGI